VTTADLARLAREQASQHPRVLRDIQDENRIASPEMLPHLICSRPMFIGGARDEADQHGGA
jgi:hypothetical protein